ncbi:tetratricopeptide repeat protein [Streptomyces sp. NPDC018019]|uniref:tetratricopeptide repeat protein n=1 Tax=Streptomyces sp. NPDC018019 TaxID=3365030 RepID=UPI0037A479DB
MTYWRMAEAHLSAGRPAQAAKLAETALAILHGPSGQWARANALTVLGQALRQTGHADRASRCWQEALEICEELGSREAPGVRKLLSSNQAGSTGRPVP